MKRKTKVSIDRRTVVGIVGNGTIAGPDQNGINIPVLVVDGTSVPAIADAIRAAEYEPDGDVQTAWGKDRRTQNELLVVNMTRPVPASFVIEFTMPGHGILVDAVLAAHCFYLRAGGPEDSFMTTFADRQIIVDVHPSEYDDRWPAVYKRALMKDFRRRGLSITRARTAAEELYEQSHKMTTFRLPGTPPSKMDQSPATE